MARDRLNPNVMFEDGYIEETRKQAPRDLVDHVGGLLMTFFRGEEPFDRLDVSRELFDTVILDEILAASQGHRRWED